MFNHSQAVARSAADARQRTWLIARHVIRRRQFKMLQLKKKKQNGEFTTRSSVREEGKKR